MIRGSKRRGEEGRGRGEPDTGISAATESKTSRENARHSDESRDSMSCSSASCVDVLPGTPLLSVRLRPACAHTGLDRPAMSELS